MSPVSRLVALALLLLMVPMVLGQDSPEALPASNQIMDWARALGFPSWAIVLVIVGNRLVSAMQDFFKMLNEHVNQTERRLSRLEAVVFMRTSPGHFIRDGQEDP